MALEIHHYGFPNIFHFLSNHLRGKPTMQSDNSMVGSSTVAGYHHLFSTMAVDDSLLLLDIGITVVNMASQ